MATKTERPTGIEWSEVMVAGDDLVTSRRVWGRVVETFGDPISPDPLRSAGPSPAPTFARKVRIELEDGRIVEGRWPNESIVAADCPAVLAAVNAGTLPGWSLA